MPTLIDMSQAQVPNMSMLVDMGLSRPIPVKAALRMIRAAIKTLLYMRGQMSSPWEQLEQLLKLEIARQAQEQGQEQKQGLVHGQEQGQGQRQEHYRHQPPIQSLQEFLETAESMFVDLEGSIYAQLFSRLQQQQKQSSLHYIQPQTSFPNANSGSINAQQTTTSVPLTMAQARSPPGNSNDLYISLAVVFGNTLTVPKEQYMIRIGPLEPQQALLLSTPPITVYDPIATTTTTTNNFVHNLHNNDRIPLSNLSDYHRIYHGYSNMHLDDKGHEYHPRYHQHRHRQQQQEQEQKQKQKQTREEKAWERKLLHQIIGMTSVVADTDSKTGNELSNGGSRGYQEQPNQLSPSLPSRAKVHLLLKAPSALTFQGLFPKQMIVLPEDFSVSEAQRASKSTSSLVADNRSRNSNRKKRWPVHHLHIFGPSTSASESGGSASAELPEIWYEVGSGIPPLSPLL
ncbi:hypothetical protein BX616_000501 [Lobosporangium transversale]|uniref:Uncharacterized protein n=1 Tax=Lobosporangium transversale TaxID=64571 RepID=A0A1Y2G525_9FUNG|nr:hypothetical protein BCR41DRAFT_390920 [Lobosporangium transversale]KAF9907240.1 hypothetical protein BX616_000501 [Lobosporangium transversale]ORY93705.1 hypothetical protein BCR41DRAFT_390920 [Lobosporangium transversale]|eukprot:XP_021875200.1 hypothetical protein BCR41DRAFT_390920 [Lobosporangium transversale]